MRSPRRLVCLVLAGGCLAALLIGCGGSPSGLEATRSPIPPPLESGGSDSAVPDLSRAVSIVAYNRAIGSAALTVPGAGGITGIVRKDTGDPRVGARVVLEAVTLATAEADADVPAAAASAVRTGGTGQYGFANVPPGRWRIRCSNPDKTVDTQALGVRPDGLERCTFGGDRAVVELRMRPLELAMIVGDRRRLRTVGYNAAGQLVTGYTPSWRSLNPRVAPVSRWGVVRARSGGRAEVEAAVDGATARAQVEVVAPEPQLANLFFLHHSTGDGIIVEGGVRAYVEAYNRSHGTGFEFWDHGYNGDGLRDPLGVFTGTSYDVPDDNTDPDGLHRLWTGSDAAAVHCRNTILANHGVIAFKSCFPASAIASSAELNQYRSWYLDIRDFLDTRADKVFVVMSTPPLHRLSTNATEAANARRFADWLSSDTYLAGHPNVVCFDLFDHLAAPNDGSPRANRLRYAYEGSHSDGDSHPNTLANETVGPVFAQALIDAASR